VRKAIFVSIAVSIGATQFLAGCGNQTAGIPVPPKWPGAPYHLSFGPAPAKPNPTGLTIPPINYNANPEMLETRTDLVIQIDTSTIKSASPVMDEMTMAAVDISGATGTLSADYVNRASKDLSTMLAAYCVLGKVKISVALTKSSIPANPTIDQINSHRISDWLPITLDFKNPHPKC